MEATWRDRLLMWWVVGIVLLSVAFGSLPIWI